MQLNERKNKYIQQWLDLAEEDLRIAEFTFKMESSIPYRAIAFHAQQAAEKYLKALLVFYNIDFPYTHDILKLIELAPDVLDLKTTLEPAIKLTDYAVSRRYPDVYQNLTFADAKESVELARLTKQYAVKPLIEAGFKV